MKQIPDDVADRIMVFLEEIGIPLRVDELPANTFLPGVEVVDGGLVVDRAKLVYPGDLLHEAGHLAVAPAEIRPALSGEVVVPGVAPDLLEFVTMVWSYAAALHLELDPSIVFHDGGYRGQAEGLLMNFSLGIFPTLHILEDFGMAYGPSKAAEIGVEAFPKMVRWLRE